MTETLIQTVVELLDRDDVRGRILRDTALIEDEMGIAIEFYFTTNERYKPFEELILPRLGFNDRISVLERIPYRKKYLSLKSLVTIRQLQQVRNLVAHMSWIHENDRKLQNGSWLHLFSDYPKSYESAVKKASIGLGRLIGSNEFIDHYAPNRRKAT